jgi:hypothetical protein
MQRDPQAATDFIADCNMAKEPGDDQDHRSQQADWNQDQGDCHPNQHQRCDNHS